MSAESFIGAPVWTHDKRGGDRLMAGVREHEGHRFFDLRLWTDGGKTPTRKGATMPLDAVPEFAKALVAFVASTSADRTTFET